MSVGNKTVEIKADGNQSKLQTDYSKVKKKGLCINVFLEIITNVDIYRWKNREDFLENDGNEQRELLQFSKDANMKKDNERMVLEMTVSIIPTLCGIVNFYCPLYKIYCVKDKIAGIFIPFYTQHRSLT